MEGDKYLGWKKNGSSKWVRNVVEEEEEEGNIIIASVPQPETPKEPMEFLSRSWSLSASEISKALLAKKDKDFSFHNKLNAIPEMVISNHFSGKVMNLEKNRRTGGAIGRWFHHQKEYNQSSRVKKKDKGRVENAHMHSALSVAGLSAALAAVASAENRTNSSVTTTTTTKMSTALASATELLASHCIELAESAGADHDRVAAVVRSAVDVRNASDLVTLTAAAATALRGEAALKSRLPKEPKRNAAITPCDKRSMVDTQSFTAFPKELPEEETMPCIGDLLQHTRKGLLRWKHVSVYINKKSQVIIKLKSKHVGGAFSKKNKCVVYKVCDETSTWPFKKERENVEVYFGVKTGQGLVEFKCKNKIHKQKWVDGIQDLLRRSISIEDAAENSLRMLSLTKTI